MSGRLLSDITRALPAKPVDVSVDGTRVPLTCGSARFSLPTMAVEDYPTLPALPDETGVISADLFAEAIGQVAVAAGRDDTLPMLTGIRVEISGETVVLAATDRFRLAVRELTWSTTSADVEAALLVPAKTLAEAAKAGISGGDVALALGAGANVGKEGLLGIRSEGKRSTTRLLDAEFPKFRQLLARRTHRHRHDRRRRTDRSDQACRAGGGPRRAGPDGIQPRGRCGWPPAPTTSGGPKKICPSNSPVNR